MCLGRRQEPEAPHWVSYRELPRGPAHMFYGQLNRLLDEAGFDQFVEELCAPCYHDRLGRPGVPPGVYFRMLLIGYFEGIDSQRGIVWRCQDSLSLRRFPGYGLADSVPDHSSLTPIRQRLPEEVYQRVFQWMLRLLEEKGLISARQVGVGKPRGRQGLAWQVLETIVLRAFDFIMRKCVFCQLAQVLFGLVFCALLMLQVLLFRTRTPALT